MHELRKDYILDRWVIVSDVRKKRPHETKLESKQGKDLPEVDKNCFFCRGNEHLTPKELGRISSDSSKEGWAMRWFSNKFPMVKPEGDPRIKTDNTFFTFASAYGEHEIIVETNRHDRQITDFSKEEIANLLSVYGQRIEHLVQKEGVNYVVVFKNHGAKAGASLVHSHSQVVSLNKMPPEIVERLHEVNKYDSCPYCRVISIEKNSDRRCFENRSFVAFTPYASRFHYEVWVFPKEHFNSLTQMNYAMLEELSDILYRIFQKLKELGCDFNMQLIHSLKHGELHFHIEITPRMATWAGFEFESGIIINSLPPEEAARFYRGEI